MIYGLLIRFFDAKTLKNRPKVVTELEEVACVSTGKSCGNQLILEAA